MRYEDASNSFQASGPQANDDSDQLPAGAKEAATGNLITGEGTQYGAAGADSAAGGHITSIAGKGGEDSSFAGGKLSVAGEFGKLTVDAEGNYSYKANNNAPENVRDRFTYTLADNQGGTDTAALVIELGKTQVVIKADAQQIVPGPDGVVTLPPGVELSDVMVVGRNLVINMPDGTQLIIVDGAVFVPQLVVDGVSVPATNVAALLIGQEPQPAAGELPPSSGGNFAVPPPPLDPGVPLGDLLPPTDTNYIPPEPEELFPEEDREPTIVIQPVDQAPSVNAIDSVDERGLPTRNGGEPEGTGEGADGNASNNSDPSEATSGTIIIDSPDGIDSVTIAGADGIPHDIVVGLVVQGQYGTLTITGIVGDDYTYSYVLNDNTSGDNTHDNFAVVLTDSDGDVASASLTINIIDDVPTARDDVDSVNEGGPTVADGNVLTGSGGADANNTDGVKDTVGADDADVTGFNQGGTNGTLGVPFAAHYGTLVLNADGSYTYTLDSEDPAVRALGNGDTLTEVFTYSLTDGDGDVDTATLTITIIGSNDAPTIGSSAAVVSEEGLPGGIEDNVGSDDTTNSATASGTVPVSDPDGDPLTVTLTTTGLAGLGLESNGVPIVWALSNGGHTLTGSAGGEPIITITIQDDGDYTVELTGPVDHPNDAIEDDLSFDISVSVSDGSETTTGGKITLTIEDDSPTVTAGEVEPQLLVDESDFTVNETQSFGDVFTVMLGGDGGSSSSTSYALGVNPGSTGLVDTLTNAAVVLTLEGGTVVGRAGDGGPIVFVISVNADGDVTVDQQRAVVHADPNNPDDTISLADDNLITLTATAEDNDGDTASATIGLGKNVVLADDGPSINRNEQAAPDLVTDDSNTPNDTDSASFAGLFTGAFGADGPKDADNNDVADSDAIVYNLSINGGDGTESGLFDVLTGDRILLRVDGNSIEGYLENDTGVVAFTLTLDPNTGVVTQEQDRAITHDDPTDPVESGGDAETMASNLIVITATITDGDGDQDSASANIGDSFHFEDDGPSVSPSGEEPSLTVDESALGTDDSADFSGAFSVLFGADGPAASNDTTFALGISGVGVASGLVDTLSGDPILLFMNGDVVEGRVGGVGGAVAFTVSVNSSGVVELDQLRSVVHDDPTDPNEDTSPAQLSSDGLITLTATATDGDGDSDSATIGIGKNLNFLDDGPSIGRTENSAPILTTDDTNIPGDTDGPVSFAGLFSGNFGADGFKDSDDNDVQDPDAIAYSLSLKAGNTTDSGLFDVVSGDKILLRVNGSGDVEGYLQNSPGTVAFTIDLQAGGNIRLVQNRAITHDDPNDPNETGSSAATMASDLVVLTATITDGDGDQDSATANIGNSFRFEDDGPQAFDDTDSVGAPGTSATGNVITGVDIVGGDANGTDGTADDVGSDTPGSIVGVAAGDTNAILSNPATVGVQIQGDFGKLTLNANGSYTYTRDAGSPGGGEDVFTYTLTDADGDKVTATLTIQIGDAVPVAGTASAAVDDDGLSGANSAANPNDINANTFPNPDDLDGPASSEATFRGMLTVTGGDGDIDFSLVAPGAGITVGQETVTISGTGALLTATITASPDADRIGDPLFTVSLNQETGEYIVTLVDNVLHGDDANNDEDGSEVSVNIPFQVVDADGDASAANGTLNIVFNDDVPTATNDTDAVAAGSTGPATGNVMTGVEVAVPEDANATDGNADTVGADGARVTFIDNTLNVAAGSNVPAGGSVAIAGQFGTLTIYANGDYSYARTAGQGGGQSEVFQYTLTDADGDQSTATLTINIGDLTPVAGTANAAVDDDGLTGANASAGANDINANTQPNPDDLDGPASSEATFRGQLTVTSGDGDIDFALVAPVGAVTVGQETVNITGTGALLTATIATSPDSDRVGDTLFTVSLDQETGEYIVTLVDNVLHGDDANNDEDGTEVSVNIPFQVVDADGDASAANGTLNIVFNDDVPVNFTPVALTDADGTTATLLDDALVNDGTAHVTRFLNDANANPANGENFIGADGFGKLEFTGGSNGDPLVDSDGAPRTSGDAPIFLFGFGTGVLTATTSATNSDPNAVVFTATLHEGAGNGSASTYELEFFQTIDDGSGFVLSDFSDAPAGQNEWIGLDSDGGDINDDNNDSPDLLLTHTNVGGTVNTSATDIGNGNQWIGSGEGIRVDHVIDVRRDGANDEDDATGYTFDGHITNLNGSSFTVMQIQGSGTGASVRISAFNDPDTGNIKTLGGTPVAIDINSIVVTGDASYTIINMNDGTFVITGLAAGANVAFDTGGAAYNAITITSAAGLDNPNVPGTNLFGGQDFAIGEFGFFTQGTGEPVNFELDVLATDADGDTSTGTIDFSLVPDDVNALNTLAANNMMAQEQQLQKVAANSNTLALATAVAAAGFVEPVAARDNGKHDGHGQNNELGKLAPHETVERHVASDDDGKAAVSMLAPEASNEVSAPAARSSNSSSDHSNHSNSVDNSSAHAAPESNDAPAADGGSAHSAAAAAGPVAPTVAMVSAEALQAVANNVGHGQKGGSVEQVVAEAMHHGGSEIDAVLANLPGGNGGLQAIAHMASPDVAAVSGWHMGSHGAVTAGLDMMFKMDVATHHQDAVQPVHNG